jgi:hypothetical protein
MRTRGSGKMRQQTHLLKLPFLECFLCLFLILLSALVLIAGRVWFIARRKIAALGAGHRAKGG